MLIEITDMRTYQYSNYLYLVIRPDRPSALFLVAEGSSDTGKAGWTLRSILNPHSLYGAGSDLYIWAESEKAIVQEELSANSRVFRVDIHYVPFLPGILFAARHPQSNCIDFFAMQAEKCFPQEILDKFDWLAKFQSN